MTTNAGNVARREVRDLAERVAALELENERRLDENRRLVEVVRSQSETLQMLVGIVGDRR